MYVNHMVFLDVLVKSLDLRQTKYNSLLTESNYKKNIHFTLPQTLSEVVGRTKYNLIMIMIDGFTNRNASTTVVKDGDLFARPHWKHLPEMSLEVFFFHKSWSWAKFK